MLITKSFLPHVCQLNGAFGASVHEPITTLWVEFSSCDNLRQLFHVGRLDIDNVEALVLNVQVPQVYPQIVTANKGFSIAVHRDAVDVVGMGICICSAGYCGHDRIVVGEAG